MEDFSFFGCYTSLFPIALPSLTSIFISVIYDRPSVFHYIKTRELIATASAIACSKQPNIYIYNYTSCNRPGYFKSPMACWVG